MAAAPVLVDAEAAEAATAGTATAALVVGQAAVKITLLSRCGTM